MSEPIKVGLTTEFKDCSQCERNGELNNIQLIYWQTKKEEENANQILDFTREIKNSDEDFKTKLIEALWKIIFSDNEADMYESSLMRRLSGLLYLDNKVVGEIKEKIKKELNEWLIL